MYVNPRGKGKHNIVKNGDTFINNSGEKIVVIDYRSATDVIVQFEDGATRSTTSTDLSKGKEGREYLSHYKTPEEAYKAYLKLKKGTSKTKP